MDLFIAVVGMLATIFIASFFVDLSPLACFGIGVLWGAAISPAIGVYRDRWRCE